MLIITATPHKLPGRWQKTRFLLLFTKIFHDIVFYERECALLISQVKSDTQTRPRKKKANTRESNAKVDDDWLDDTACWLYDGTDQREDNFVTLQKKFWLSSGLVAVAVVNSTVSHHDARRLPSFTDSNHHHSSLSLHSTIYRDHNIMFLM